MSPFHRKSLYEKLCMRHEQKPYETIEDIRKDIIDLAGVRIILYMPSQDQRDKVREAINSIWGSVEPILFPTRPEDHRDPAASSPKDEYREVHLGYQAIHYRVPMQQSQSQTGGYDWVPRDRVEIQVVSALVHAWAEVGHDVLYKSHAYGKPTIQERRILDSLKGLIQSGDLLMEQFQELVDERTYKKFAHPGKLGSYLRDLDILQCEGERPEFESEAVGILFKFLEKSKMNYPLALRDALKELGFPSQNNPLKIEGLFYPEFQPAKAMLATVYLIQQMIGDRKTKTEHNAPAKQCYIMMKALSLLQTFFGSAHRAKEYLRDDVKMADDEKLKESMEYVLTDPDRQWILEEHNKEYDNDLEAARPSLQEAWEWFQKQADVRSSICGLVFRLAEMEAVREVTVEALYNQLNIGTLSRPPTWPVRDGSDDQSAS